MQYVQYFMHHKYDRNQGFGPDNLKEGRFMCIRRANDTSQSGNFVAAPSVGVHDDENFGSHHAKDSYDLFSTLGYDLNMFSSAMKVNSQYMYVLWFYLKTKEAVTLNDVLDRLHANDLVATTSKNMINSVFFWQRPWAFWKNT